LKIETKIFSSKISKRIFATFVACALLPVVCLAIIAYFQVTSHLQNQALKSLRHASKFQAKNLVDRLNNLENELEIISLTIKKNSHFNRAKLNGRFRNRLLNQFNSITHFIGPKQFHPILNQLTIKSLRFESDDIKHLSTGKTLLTELSLPNSKPTIIMVRQINIEKSAEGFVIGEINLNYLWGINEIDNLPLDTAYCVLDSSKNPLHCSLNDLIEIESTFQTFIKSSTTGYYGFIASGEKYIASYTEIFLKPNYKLPHWTIILFKAKSDIFAPITKFRIIFSLLIVLTLLVVLWLSNINIRKNLLPINALNQGAKRITKRNFSKEVIVSSNDEFHELAVSFNKMSHTLEDKFKTLSAKADIDRAILSTLNREEIIKAAVTRIAVCIACDACGISLIDSLSLTEARAFHSFGHQNKTLSSEAVQAAMPDLKMIERNPSYFIIQPNNPLPNYIPTKSFKRMDVILILPIWLKNKLQAVLWIGRINSKEFIDEDITLSRQLADQIAVALSNSNLIEELKEMNLGMLQAFARLVDAKSPWTAGHSHRVCELALSIAEALNLQLDDRENLHRAALLHDIGKIGVPSNILNKTDKLSDEEFRLIKNHPSLGAKILEPIIAYKGIIPIVSQHHERFDGLGYPVGIAGKEIHKGARILAVADVYDALSSDRPYRKGWTRAQVINFMKKGAGREFDPMIVEALLEVIKIKQQKAA
jgi:putative nucleotidyltransferase with HDIG domain